MTNEPSGEQLPAQPSLSYVGQLHRLFSNVRGVKQRQWLAVYSCGHSLTECQQITGTDRRLHYLWIKVVDGYREAFEQATQIRADHVEDEIYRRGVMGYYEELSYKGEATGSSVKRYSDVLAIVAAKALRPHKYRENTPATAVINAPMRVSFTINVGTNTDSIKEQTTLEIKPTDK